MEVQTILFVVSSIIVLHWFVAVVGIICGHSVNVPVPILYKWGLEFTNVYVSCSGIAFQVWFWFSKLGVI